MPGVEGAPRCGRAWFEIYGTPAAAVTAAPLGKDLNRVARREVLLAAVDPDRRNAWQVDWRRNCTVLCATRLPVRSSAAGDEPAALDLVGADQVQDAR